MSKGMKYCLVTITNTSKGNTVVNLKGKKEGDSQAVYHFTHSGIREKITTKLFCLLPLFWINARKQDRGTCSKGHSSSSKALGPSLWPGEDA